MGIVRQLWVLHSFALKHLTRCFPSCWHGHSAGLTVRQLNELNWQKNKHKKIVFCQHSSPIGRRSKNHNTMANIQQVSSRGIAWWYPKPSYVGPNLLYNIHFLWLTSSEQARNASSTAPFPAAARGSKYRTNPACSRFILRYCVNSLWSEECFLDCFQVPEGQCKNQVTVCPALPDAESREKEREQKFSLSAPPN